MSVLMSMETPRMEGVLNYTETAPNILSRADNIHACLVLEPYYIIEKIDEVEMKLKTVHFAQNRERWEEPLSSVFCPLLL